MNFYKSICFLVIVLTSLIFSFSGLSNEPIRIGVSFGLSGKYVKITDQYFRGIKKLEHDVDQKTEFWAAR